MQHRITLYTCTATFVWKKLLRAHSRIRAVLMRGSCSPRMSFCLSTTRATAALAAKAKSCSSDRMVLSKRGQLIAAAGKNEAQVSFDLQVRSGAVYTFELKAPATRLVFHVVGADGNTIESKFTKQSLARQIHHSFDEGQSWRVTIAGFGADLPANYELEVREYWQFNGNVPPNSWAR